MSEKGPEVIYQWSDKILRSNNIYRYSSDDSDDESDSDTDSNEGEFDNNTKLNFD